MSKKPSPRLDALMDRLKVRCEERGAKAALAKYLEVRPSMLSSWLARDTDPSGESVLGILEWMNQPN